MRVIKPIDIDELNMTSSIPEPNVSLGEVEWSYEYSGVGTTHNLYRFDFGGGFVWAHDSTNAVIYKYTEKFVFIESFDISAILTQPRGIAYASGFLWVTSNTANRVYQFDTAGNFQSFSFLISAETTTPEVLMWDGTLLNVFSNSLSTVETYSLGGIHNGQWALPMAGSLFISGAAVDGDNIYVNDTFNKNLYTLSLIDYSETNSFQASFQSGALAGCAVNDGRLFMSNSSVIYEYSTAGKKSTGYNAGLRVIKSSTHKIYESAVFNNDDPTEGVLLTPPSWVEVSPTNKYKAFDYAINTKSEMLLSGNYFDFLPAQICTTVSLFGLEDVTIIFITVREDNDSGAIIYSSSKSTAMSSPIGDDITNPTFLTDKIIFDDLPVYATPHIRISCSSISSTFKVGDIVLGNTRELGIVNYQSSTSRTSYDTVKTDIFGNETITSRPSAEYTSFEVSIEPQYSNYVERILKDALNKPRVWLGDKANDEKLFTFGYYERSPIVYASPTKYDTTLKIRGLV